MKMKALKDVKPGEKMLIPKCGFWEVESVRETAKACYYKYKDLPGEFRSKKDKIVTVM